MSSLETKVTDALCSLLIEFIAAMIEEEKRERRELRIKMGMDLEDIITPYFVREKYESLGKARQHSWRIKWEGARSQGSGLIVITMADVLSDNSQQVPHWDASIYTKEDGDVGAKMSISEGVYPYVWTTTLGMQYPLNPEWE